MIILKTHSATSLFTRNEYSIAGWGSQAYPAGLISCGNTLEFRTGSPRDRRFMPLDFQAAA